MCKVLIVTTLCRISGGSVDHSAHFEGVKVRLLDCVGQTSTKAKQEVFKLCTANVKTKSIAQVMQQI